MQLFVAYASGAVFVYETATAGEEWSSEPVGKLSHPTGVTCFLHFEGHAIVSACTDRRIRVWCVRRGTPDSTDCALLSSPDTNGMAVVKSELNFSALAA